MLRTIGAYVSLVFFVSCGGSAGTLLVAVPGIMLVTGATGFTDVLDQSGERVFWVVIAAILTGGVGGAAMGAIGWNWFVRKLNLLTDERLNRML